MSRPITEQTKAILLLTAPLIVGKQRSDGPKILTPAEYNKLAARLVELSKQPMDLLGKEREDLAHELGSILEPERILRLLERGLLMSQAIDQWQTRGIWIVSRADPDYPVRLKAKLKKQAPPVLYGCGDRALLERGGLCIVGSRKVDDAISEFVKDAAQLAAQSGYSVVSGGAKGVDLIAMRSALEVDGTVVGALAENLSRAVVSPLFREPIKRRDVTLVSAVDPNAGFNVGNAMSRNKLIYAFADAGLVANSDYEKGGTWAGATEQINRLKCCPVYVRTTDRTPKGNKALIERGAFPWPEPKDVAAMSALMEKKPQNSVGIEAKELDFNATPASTTTETKPVVKEEIAAPVPAEKTSEQSPSEGIFGAAEHAIITLLKERSMNETDLAEALGVVKTQTRAWLDALVEKGVVEKTKKPVRYRLNTSQITLF